QATIRPTQGEYYPHPQSMQLIPAPPPRFTACGGDNSFATPSMGRSPLSACPLLMTNPPFPPSAIFWKAFRPPAALGSPASTSLMYPAFPQPPTAVTSLSSKASRIHRLYVLVDRPPPRSVV